MRFGFSRIVALLLVVLGASPFTAPFSTCDLSVFGVDVRAGRDRQDQNDQKDRSQPSNDHGRHGAVVKSAGHLGHAPTLAGTAIAAAPVSRRVSRLAAQHAAGVTSRPVPIKVLRI